MITVYAQNQTEERWTAPHILGTNGFETGVGVFGVADPESDEPDALKKIVLDGLTYAECCVKGENCIVFKWLPDKVVNTVGGINGLRDCDPFPCTGPCIGPNRCFCSGGYCR
ncbi:hypothetical protein CF253_06850 [Salmonella enterica]|nr:hypothetical protein [Salmonella enterica]EBS8683883.1 hypothetical protein [Salmonella enterica]EBT3582842.1 hypothetical protein [Salmonella enterica]EBT5382256.1 hypothetical protein [Salmonella enterica]EEH9336945.1 hypothetical protein [Salmonella enterica]